MIEKLHLQNFESHPDTTVEFHKGMNCIVGVTDSGKSSLRRGIRLAAENKPSGGAFRSHWGGETKIECTTDGKVVTRLIDKKNLYKLDETEFRGFGTKVPDEIKQAFNLTEVNTQEQIDNFFLLDESSGYVASYLNKIANIEQIDSTTKSIKSELNATKRLIEHKKVDVKQKKAELKTFDYLGQLEEAIASVDTLKNKQLDIQLDIDSVKLLVKQLKKVDERIAENNAVLTMKDSVYSALENIALKKKFESDYTKLTDLLGRLSHVEHQIVQCAELSDLEPLISKVFKYKKERKVLSTKLETLESLTDKLTEVERKLKESEEKHASAKRTYDSELKKMGTCFVCGSKLK